MTEETDREKLEKLRVAIARIAGALGVDNKLEVTGKSFQQLQALARAEERGWNDLAAECVNKVSRTRLTLERIFD